MNLYSNFPFQNKIIVKHPNAGGGLAFLWKNTINLEIIKIGRASCRERVSSKV